jgi:hypothetical protein
MPVIQEGAETDFFTEDHRDLGEEMGLEQVGRNRSGGGRIGRAKQIRWRQDR